MTTRVWRARGLTLRMKNDNFGAGITSLFDARDTHGTKVDNFTIGSQKADAEALSSDMAKIGMDFQRSLDQYSEGKHKH